MVDAGCGALVLAGCGVVVDTGCGALVFAGSGAAGAAAGTGRDGGSGTARLRSDVAGFATFPGRATGGSGAPAPVAADVGAATTAGSSDEAQARGDAAPATRRRSWGVRRFIESSGRIGPHPGRTRD